MEKSAEVIEELKVRVLHPNAARLVVERIPKDLKQFIIDFAHKHCCGDYGWALNMLIGPVTHSNDAFRAVIEDHEARLNKLENKPKEEPKALHGRARFGKEKEEKKDE